MGWYVWDDWFSGCPDLAYLCPDCKASRLFSELGLKDERSPLWGLLTVGIMTVGFKPRIILGKRFQVIKSLGGKRDFSTIL